MIKNLLRIGLGLGCWLLASLVTLSGCRPGEWAESPTSTSVAATRTPVPAPPTATPTSESAFPTHSDIPYIDDGDRKHKLDIYLPQEVEGLLPTLFVIRGLEADHRGALRNASKNTHDALARHFARRGYAVVLIDYRYPGQPWGQEMTQDTFCSLAWVHTNAERYGLDPQRIVAFGDQFGAMLAAKLGTVDDPDPFLEGCPHQLPESGWVTGIVTYGGLFFTPEATLSVGLYVMQFIGSYQLQSELPYKEMTAVLETLRDVPPREWQSSSELEEETRKVAALTPLYWADDGDPRFLLIHGAEDTWIFPAHSEEFAAGLQAVGAEAELLLVPGAGGASLKIEEESATIYEAMEAFLINLFE